MSDFKYHNGQLHAEDISLKELAEQYGTPSYVYSRAGLTRQYQAYTEALSDRPHVVCYAVKANSNIAVLNLLARLGAGFDIVSMGELERVLAAGGDPAKVVFSGVGKTAAEMARALEVGVMCFNVESEAEIQLLARVAEKQQKVAPVSVRVNPDVDAKTHPYTATGLKENKFGIDINQVLEVYRFASQQKFLSIVGVDCHIGSQLTDIAPFTDALDRILLLIDRLQEELNVSIEHLDIGGGLGVDYQREKVPSISEYITAVKERLGPRTLTLVLEPGRSIAANAGVLLTKVEYLKPTDHKNFAIVDAAMNDNIRPALYQAWMDIYPVQEKEGQATSWDIVGPVCETGDFLGKDRQLVLHQGDLLALMTAGAYGFTMSSNYNSRPRAAEIMVDGTKAHLIRRRECFDDLIRGEQLLPSDARGKH